MHDSTRYQPSVLDASRQYPVVRDEAFIKIPILLAFLSGLFPTEDPRGFLATIPDGNEVDLIERDGSRVHAIEIKAGATINRDYFKGLRKFKNTFPDKFLDGTRHLRWKRDATSH